MVWFGGGWPQQILIKVYWYTIYSTLLNRGFHNEPGRLVPGHLAVPAVSRVPSLQAVPGALTFLGHSTGPGHRGVLGHSAVRHLQGGQESVVDIGWPHVSRPTSKTKVACQKNSKLSGNYPHNFTAKRT